MDEIDKRILSFLLKDGRMSLIDISKNLEKYGINISAPSIKRRIMQLMETGIIKQFTAVLDYEKLGISSLAFINLKVEPSKVSNIARSFSYLPEVRDVYIVQDDYNLVVCIQCENYKEINRLIERFASSRNILDTKTRVILDSYSKLNSSSSLLGEADVIVGDVDRDGKEEVVLDNPLISATVKPHICARVTEFVLKETGSNQAKAGDGLLLDNFAEEGWGQLANLPSQWRIVDANDKLVRVKFSALFSGSRLKDIRLEKTLTMYSDSPVLRVDYRIINESKEKQEATLWISNYIAAGGEIDEADCFFLPVEGKMESDLYRRQSFHVMWPVTKPEALGKDAYRYVTIEQPEIRSKSVSDGWAAWMDTRLEEVIGFFWDKRKAAYIKRCYLLNSYSFEIIFNTVALNPGEHVDHQLYLMVGRGGQDLVWQQYDKLRGEFEKRT